MGLIDPWGYARRLPVHLSFELVAVFVAAVSGALAGRQKGMDWFGMYVVGVLAGMGGGTLRSLLMFGGVLRDIARAEVPLIFRREIYATACLAGGLVLVALDHLGVRAEIGLVVITVMITGIRLLAIRYSLNESSD